MTTIDLRITGAAQVLTMAPATPGRPKVGADLAELGLLAEGGLVAREGRIVAVGPSDRLRRDYRLAEEGVEVDARGGVVLPAFVDPHTHVLFAGTREWEFEQRLEGKSYMQIAAAGGGILSSVAMFRAASDEALLAESLRRMDQMAAFGTGTVEVKTGYALEPEQELRALRLIAELGRRHPLQVVATYLGAHEVPAEYRPRTDDYVDLLVEEMIPAAGRLGIARFCDVFCEKGVFDVAQSRRILQAARQAGMTPKLHADEIEPMGGAELAAEVEAISADHLGRISDAGMAALAAADTVAVLLPGTLFCLKTREYAPARKLIRAGVPVAIATDCNPGSSMTESMPWIIALACLQMDMTPAEALVAATYNAAAALGLAGDRGALLPGYRADVQVLAAPSYARLPYHVGYPDLADLFVGGRPVVRGQRPRLCSS